MALPGLAGRTAVPASSALIVRARAFRAWLEPLIPSLRRARLDTGFPAAASLLAAMRAWPMPGGVAVAALASWSCRGAVAGPCGRTGPGRGAWGAAWSWAAPAWSSADQAGDRRYCWSSGPVVRCVRCGAGIGAQHVGQRGPHGQDQDRQAGHDRGDGPRCPRRPGLGQQVVGHLPGHAEREGADRGPLGEPAGPAADRVLAGQPGAQRVRGVRLHADGQGDGRVQVQRRQDARQRGDQPEPGLLRDADPAGPHLGRGRGGQDQQRPGPDGPGAGGDRGGPVPSGWSGGPGSGRTAWSQIRGGAGAVHARGKCGHGGHHPSCVASGWGSPVSAARAAATSWVVART